MCYWVVCVVRNLDRDGLQVIKLYCQQQVDVSCSVILDRTHGFFQSSSSLGQIYLKIKEYTDCCLEDMDPIESSVQLFQPTVRWKEPAIDNGQLEVSTFKWPWHSSHLLTMGVTSYPASITMALSFSILIPWPVKKYKFIGTLQSGIEAVRQL